ncbi:MAG: hypothetical protein AAGL24_27590 [Pseudomonadota bacterium]
MKKRGMNRVNSCKTDANSATKNNKYSKHMKYAVRCFLCCMGFIILSVAVTHAAGFVCSDLMKKYSENNEKITIEKKLIGNKYVIFDQRQKKCKKNFGCEIEIWAIDQEKRDYIVTLRGSGEYFSGSFFWSERYREGSQLISVYHFRTRGDSVTSIHIPSQSNTIILSQGNNVLLSACR